MTLLTNVFCFQAMALLIESALYFICFMIAVISLVYTHFKRSFQVWKRKNVPYFEPNFPNGNRQPLHRAVPIAQDVFNLTQKAKAKGNDSCNIIIRVTKVA